MKIQWKSFNSAMVKPIALANYTLNLWAKYKRQLSEGSEK